jgi:hypothetical protein
MRRNGLGIARRLPRERAAAVHPCIRMVTGDQSDLHPVNVSQLKSSSDLAKREKRRFDNDMNDFVMAS